MKIYDCFTFYNEYEILEIRLSTYYDYVDYFVISESNRLFTGGEKPLNFLLHKDRFAKYADKIIYITADASKDIKDVKKIAKDNREENWGIEFFQRDAIANALKNCSPDDIILISDLDEFIPIELINELKLGNSKKSFYTVCRPKGKKNLIKFILTPQLALQRRRIWPTLKYKNLVVTQNMYYYFMNTKMNEKWNGTIISLFKNFTSPQNLRNIRNCTFSIYKKNKDLAGWHFSYLGGKDKIKEKLFSIVDGHHAFKYENLDEHIEDCIRNQKDLFDRGFSFSIQSNEEIGFPNISSIENEYPHFFYK